MAEMASDRSLLLHHLGIGPDMDSFLASFSESLISGYSDGIFSYDKNFNILLWSPLMETLTGFEEKNVLGTNIFEVMPGLNRQEVAASLQLALEGKKITLPDLEIDLPSSRGPSYLTGKCFPLLGRQKEPIGGITLLSVNSDPKKLENLLQDVVNNSALGIIIAESVRDEQHQIIDFKMILVTDAVSSILKIPKNDFYTHTFLQLFPGSINSFFLNYARVVETGQTLEFEEYYGSEGFDQWFKVIAVKRGDGLIITFEDITDRIRNEQKIAEQNEQLKQAQNLARMGNYELDVASKKLTWSDSLYMVFEVERNHKELSLDLLFSLVHPKDLQSLQSTIREAIKTGIEHSYEYRIITPKGNHKYIRGLLNPRRNADGKVISIIGYSQDITDLKMVQNSLSHTLDQLKESHKLANMGHWNLNLHTNEFVLSDECCRILGFPTGTRIKYDEYINYLFPEEIPIIDKKIKTAIAEKNAFMSEYRFRRPDDKIMWILAFGKISYNQDGTPECLAGLQQDITEQKESEMKLKEAYLKLQEAQANLKEINLNLEEIVAQRTRDLEVKNSELEHLISEVKFFRDFIPQLVWSTYPDGNHDYFNKRWNEYTGMNLETSKNTGWLSVLHPEDYERTINVWRHSMQTIEPYEVEYRLRRHDGAYRWFLGRANALRDKEGKIRKWFGTCTDIHDQKVMVDQLSQAREALSKQNEKLQRVNNDLDNFVYTASHDLKAPINNIEGLVTTLAEIASGNEEMRMLLDMIKGSVSRFKATIHDLADITKATNYESLNIELIDIAALIAEIKSDIQPQLESSQAIIRENLRQPHYRFFRKNFRSILYNLISNAVKYRSPERFPEVDITTMLEGNHFVLIVQDNGLGIREEDKPKIFSMFKRLHTHVEGTGIGMYLVKRIVEDAGGKIELESKVGKGSAFRIYLPAHPID